MPIGVVIPSETVAKFQHFQFGRTLIYLVLKIEDEKNVVEDFEGEKGKSISDLKSQLPDSEPRYILIHHGFIVDGTPRGKTFLLLYTPTGTSIRKKMIYASAKGEVKSALNGIQIEMDVDESFSSDDLTEKATRI
ncbi:cofilin/ADF [Monocercomonoides exilis]|uniref:cofilin/ADF n=1 Tax=Monocercomonoides exilis TaxID=2049356 RepID=UPI003559C16A|nr:cofilin/ADF [Monocercomonoides exilis]|eukprot:MONOS_16236.1-p1 / transcript=MONOS_16236.1 / gene=MONOS_16236 / organism=Monocercomonoides_exilis_PA203 / gene_product=cofilin/ADF / transcript_product=cofilin/ADF / location=Mono_scaffold01580:3187-3657(-) / protein_length=134 / sequence_SO=supercontig / SO=protein_coding / is_pseudo=false